MAVSSPHAPPLALDEEGLRHAETLARLLRRDEPVAAAALVDEGKPPIGVIEWGEKNFWIPPPEGVGKPRLLRFLPHQKVILGMFFDPAVAEALVGSQSFQTLVYSTVKKSGKTAIAALVSRWVTETWGSHAEVYSLANDLEQARGRIYAAALASIELDPRHKRADKGIPGEWRIIEREARFLPTYSTMRAVSADYKGEAGSNPVATFWSELWGYSSEASQRLWEELTPVPTRPRSIRYVETYAGYEGESSILNDLEDRLKDPAQSKRLTYDEVRDLGYVWPIAWRDQAVPFFYHRASRTFAYWDSGVEARRMPWQTPEYYEAQAADLRESAFKRLHLNVRVSPVDDFIPIEWWDRLREDSLPPLTHETPIVIGADASVSADNTAIVAVSRDPRNPEHVLQRFCEVWSPSPGRPLDYSVTIEPALRKLCTGHIHPRSEDCKSHSKVSILGECVPSKPYNVVEIAYDEYQLHDLMTRLRNEGVAWCRKFGQQADRAVADKALHDMIRDQTIHHPGNSEMRDGIRSCGAKIPPDDNTRLRLVKKSKTAKIDPVVALSMASHECKRLNL